MWALTKGLPNGNIVSRKILMSLHKKGIFSQQRLTLDSYPIE